MKKNTIFEVFVVNTGEKEKYALRLELLHTFLGHSFLLLLDF